MYCAAAHMLQRVGTQQSQTVPGIPLSFGSPVHDSMHQRTAVAVTGGEVFGSISEAAQLTEADFSHQMQVMRSADDSAARRKEPQSHGILLKLQAKSFV